jgi:hypothetical protein
MNKWQAKQQIGVPIIAWRWGMSPPAPLLSWE